MALTDELKEIKQAQKAVKKIDHYDLSTLITPSDVKIINKLKNKFGVITEDGEFYICKFSEHYKTTILLDKAGKNVNSIIRVRKGDNKREWRFSLYGGKKLNEKMATAMLNLCMVEDLDINDAIRVHSLYFNVVGGENISDIISINNFNIFEKVTDGKKNLYGKTMYVVKSEIEKKESKLKRFI